MLPMRDLARLFAKAGCRDVQTYIQSGNVVFRATPDVARHSMNSIADGIEQHFGFRPPIVLRTANELQRIAANNPFPEAAADPARLHVAFLADTPDPRCAARLDPRRSKGDSFELRGREIYLHLPNGMARTKLTNDYFDGTLATVSTMRNWRTVLKLIEIAVSLDS